jgi:hypothetical protein
VVVGVSFNDVVKEEAFGDEAVFMQPFKTRLRLMLTVRKNGNRNWSSGTPFLNTISVQNQN